MGVQNPRQRADHNHERVCVPETARFRAGKARKRTAIMLDNFHYLEEVAEWTLRSGVDSPDRLKLLQRTAAEGTAQRSTRCFFFFNRRSLPQQSANHFLPGSELMFLKIVLRGGLTGSGSTRDFI
jgi:hypothetical protein